MDLNGAYEQNCLSYQLHLLRVAQEKSLLTPDLLEQLKSRQIALCTVVHRNWPYNGVEFYLPETFSGQIPNKADIPSEKFGSSILRRPKSQLEIDLGLEVIKPEEPENIHYSYALREIGSKNPIIEWY